MNDNDQRIAIAEAVGFTEIRERAGMWCGVYPGDKTKTPLVLPDYPHDLNAMHEAEKTLNDSRRGIYNAELSKIACDRSLSSAVNQPASIFALVTATAAQRSEAFLRTIGKWKDESA